MTRANTGLRGSIESVYPEKRFLADMRFNESGEVLRKGVEILGVADEDGDFDVAVTMKHIPLSLDANKLFLSPAPGDDDAWADFIDGILLVARTGEL